MRRGHPRIGGWRNDNPRHFRPRIGGTPHFRPSRGFGMMETPRFPPPGQRPFQGAPFNSHQGPLNEHISDHDRHQYHLNNRHNQQRPQDRQQYGQRQIFPLLHRMRHGDVPDHGNQYQETPNYYEDKHKKQSHMNMGDIDHRTNTVPQTREFNQRPSPWINPPFFEDRSHKPYRHDGGEVNKVPVQDYTGHRPPASDHYGATSGSTIDNSNTFSRSVDDTVNIVRKRLLSRESHHPSEIPPNEQGNNEVKPIETVCNYSNVHQEQPKKKTQRQRQNVKSNCDKIKNKIVDQLFMMDKDKICKLMDHPNSSTKFEYAISSLVTESQNSFNRHLRSVAEKSLCSSSTDFIHNDNNTIYEDTFMKQMQCILDPQDTVLLEDIKPMVLAELSKVLQLDDFEHRQETDETAFPALDDQVNEYPNEYNYDDYPSFETYSPGGDSAYYEQNPIQYDYEKSEMEALSNENNQKTVGNQKQFDVKPLFERRKSRKSRDYSEDRRSSSENRRKNRSVDNRSSGEAFKKNDTPAPLFDYNAENSRKNKSLDDRSSSEAFKKNDTPVPLFDYNAENSRKNKSLDNRLSGEAFKKNDTPAPLFDYNAENSRKNKSLDNRSSGEAFKRSVTPVPLFDYNPENRRKDCLDNGSSGEAFKRSGTPLPLFDGNAENRRKESLDNRSSGEAFKRSGTPIPLFDGNAEQLSEDDDPFAELDRQYHVAVDHNFLGTDFTMSPQRPSASCTPTVKQEAADFNTPDKYSYNETHNILTPDNSLYQIKKEIDNQLKSLAQSPLKLSSFSKEFSIDEAKSSQQLDSEKQHNSKSYSDHSTVQTKKQSESEPKILDNNNMKQEKTSEPKVIVEEIEIYSTDKLSTPSHSRKRSTDQRPSHRKEKRKKSESGQSDANKQILNKNIIINVNDCAAKSSENCDAPKSIFNLFFSKEKNDKEVSKESKNESADKSYSEKYVKRKETPRKTKDRDSDAKKKHDSSTSSHSMLSPNDNTIINSNNQNPSKVDPKTKLKPIDIFGDQLLKSSGTHPAHRNTAPVPNATAKTKIENKSKSSLLQVNRKISRRHIATQVIRKSVTKETQTFESKSTSSRFCQTVRKKLITRGSQTTPVSIRSETSKSTDTFERMKEIDIEIQVLLQEKFKLYSSLESNESYQNTMQSLGMAVLNVTPTDNTDVEPTIDSLEEDAIVEDFTNIPVEDLEQIALESVNVEDNQPFETSKKNRRQKVEKHDRNSSASPLSTTSAKSRRKSKMPYTSLNSLIEQIITDDRPLEDIISLDELEDPPTKPKKKSKKTPSKKKSKKKKVTKPVSIKATGYDLKECCVLLQREDFSKYLQPTIKLLEETNINVEHEDVTKTEIIEESVVNDIQFDMLDVSEDIVIGDSCEIKMVGKNENEREDMMISEEIILDNSQSSIEDNAVDVIPTDNECKMFDFSADENLRRDSITVTGNGDAVLAIECIDNNFVAACVDGNVYHFSGDGQLLNTLRGSNLAVTCLTIVKEKYETTVYTGSLDSRIRYYDLETGLEKGPECNVLSPIQTMDRAWDTVFVGTKTGFVLQFECKNNMLIPVSTVKFSEQSILALRAMKEGPRKVLLVGARSEGVTIKDAQTGLLLRTLEGPKMTIYSLLFEDGKVYCGTSTHQIHVYDYASGSHVNVHEGGKGAVCLRAAGGLLFAGCYDGCVYVYCEGEPRPRAQLRGPPHMLLSLAIQGSKIIAGYNDRSLYIWKIPLSILQEIIL